MTKSDHDQLPTPEVEEPPDRDNEADSSDSVDSSKGVSQIRVSQIPDGVELQLTMDVPEGVRLQVTVERIAAEHTDRQDEPLAEIRVTTPVSTASKARGWSPQFPRLPKKLDADMRRAIHSVAPMIQKRLRAIPGLGELSPASILFGISIVLYLTTRLWGLDRFPIFFYSDEANNVLFGEQVLAQDFRGSDDALLPVYFEWDHDRWAPVLPVYAHALTSALFGKSIFVARATTSLLGFFGVLAVALLLKQIFKARLWWISVLLLTTIPAWFLYTRTAFETVVGTALYAGFLLCYMLYRYRSPQYLYAAIVLGACAFYSYSNLHSVMMLLSLMLFISDLRYHKQHTRVLVGALLLIVALSLPFLRFRIQHPTAIDDHLQSIHSYWTEPISPQEKIVQFVRHYARGLSPAYWFSVDNGESDILPNQRMPGTGNLGLSMLPFMSIGTILCLRHWRSSAHRSVLIAALVIPAGAAMDSIEIPRMLAFVVPATVLATLGLEWLSKKLNRIPYPVLVITLLLIFSVMGLGMLRQSLLEGPTWNTDYGLYGMQYGVKQVFTEAVPQLLADNPDAEIIMTTTWANNTNLFLNFFLTQQQRKRVKLGNVADFLKVEQELDNDMIITMTAPEFDRASSSPLLASIDLVHSIDDPTGTPAFYFARIAYVDDTEKFFLDRVKPVEEVVVIDGRSLRVLHSPLDMGRIINLFDGDFETLVRGERANPFILEFHFPRAQRLRGVRLIVGSMPDFTVTVRLAPANGSVSSEFIHQFLNLDLDPEVEIPFSDEALLTSSLQIEIMNNHVSDEAKIHVREVQWY